MKLRFEQLGKHLQQGIRPVYFLSGDEPLQLMEAADMIRHRAREQGFTEREVLHAERGFDWNELLSSANAMSLFAEQKVIDLRLPSGKPGDAGAKAFRAYAENPPQENLLLITSGKLERSQTRSKWYQALEQAGAAIEIWPVEPAQLPGWIANRLKRDNLTITAEAAKLLAERVEGNLLAAAQELDKLRLLYPEKTHFELDDVEEGVADSARYTVFSLTDAALMGDARRVTRIMEGLKQEGLEAVIILWGLSREIRTIVNLIKMLTTGTSAQQAYRSAGVWDKRKSMVQSAMNRLPERVWQQLLMRCGVIDRMIKGQEEGNPWSELLQLALLMSGKRII